jgi:curved DNA-binding protein CbpA
LTIRADDGKKFSMGFKFGKVIVYTGQGKTRQASKSEVKRYYTALAKKEKKQLGD